MNRIEKMKSEIEAIEKRVHGTPAEAAIVEDVEVKDVVETVEVEENEVTSDPVENTIDAEDLTSSTEETSTDSKESDSTDDKAHQRTNWKKRFINYKSSTDATIYKLRQENIRLNEDNLSYKNKVSELAVKVQELSTKTPQDVLSQEEREILGDDAVSSVQKLVDTKIRMVVDPLQKQLDEARTLQDKLQKDSIEESKVVNHNIFLSKLANIVPDYEEIDTDPKWLTWMKGIEDESGLAREYIFKEAYSIGDVRRVAQYFIEFKNATKSPLERHVTPSNTNTNTTSIQRKTGPEVISMAFVNKFYDDCIRGRYRGREKIKQEIELKIDRAIAEGRVSK